MSFTDKQNVELNKKLDPSYVRPPKQFGPKGSYIEGWHAISEANRIFGFDGWSYEVIEARCVCENPRQIGQQKKDGWGVTYTAKVRVTINGIVREDFGAGHGYDVDAGLAHESAVKEAVTDSLKRALRTFGNIFGLALYDKDRAGVEAPEAKNNAPRQQANDAAAKPVSAAEMKRGLLAIDQDLLDCHTVGDVNKCAKIWAVLMERDKWSKDYRDVAAPKFQARRDQINTQSAEDVFPGDLPTLMAG